MVPTKTTLFGGRGGPYHPFAWWPTPCHTAKSARVERRRLAARRFGMGPAGRGREVRMEGVGVGLKEGAEIPGADKIFCLFPAFSGS